MPYSIFTVVRGSKELIGNHTPFAQQKGQGLEVGEIFFWTSAMCKDLSKVF